MEPELLQYILIFCVGFACGALLILFWNKLRSGSASPSSLREEYDEYKGQVEDHFEATSKKFQDMTEQYQDLYNHLSVGATSLCRPDSVAAALADQSNSALTLEQKNSAEQSRRTSVSESVQTSAAAAPVAHQSSSMNETAEQAERQQHEAKVEEVLGEQTAEALKEAAAENAGVKQP